LASDATPAGAVPGGLEAAGKKASRSISNLRVQRCGQSCSEYGLLLRITEADSYKGYGGICGSATDQCLYDYLVFPPLFANQLFNQIQAAQNVAISIADLC
jgi:hypothetical protein